MACGMLIVEMSKIGQKIREHAVALKGLVPIAKDSRQMRWKRTIGDCCRVFRCVLHQAAPATSNRDPNLKVLLAIYEKPENRTKSS